MNCERCKRELQDGEVCTCTQPEQGAQFQPQQPIEQHVYHHYQAPPVRQTNGCATGGFVCALLGLIFCWIPFVGALLLLLGLILSIVGIALAKSRDGEGRGLAIAGLVLALIPLIVILIIAVGAVGFAGCVSGRLF